MQVHPLHGSQYEISSSLTKIALSKFLHRGNNNLCVWVALVFEEISPTLMARQETGHFLYFLHAEKKKKNQIKEL